MGEVVRARVLLGSAIVLQVVGTLSLRASEGFTRLGWTLLVVGLAAAALASAVCGPPTGFVDEGERCSPSP